ncbi:MAG: MgtC/SapB family protein [Candidatus Schekmanbacteria bacterium]|nr:MAG: MgtC/SapB family protein [Candidatus Schekmanbacteria bacterium]
MFANGYQTALLRIVITAILSGIIGLERERRNQPAGFRTHIILGIGSVLTMLVSTYMADIYPQHTNDPARIAAQVVTGVGFLGAGAILRFGANVKGLTTAASLWTTAVIGLAIGCGFYFGGIVATFIIVVALTLLNKVEKYLLGSKGDKSLILSAIESSNLLGEIEEALASEGISILNIKLSKNIISKEVDINAVIRISPDIDPMSIQKRLYDIEGITEVEIR